MAWPPGRPGEYDYFAGRPARYAVVQKIWRYEDGIVPNLLAISYALIAYAGGMTLIMMPSLAVNLPGALLLAHGMVIAAYLVHECAHNTVFAKNRNNARLGELLNWLTGALYVDYEAIRHKHFRHHVDRADVVAFDYRKKLPRYRRLVRIMAILEWLYIPAVQIMMHVLAMVMPFLWDSRKQYRKRVILVLVLRTLYFGALASIAPRVLLFYPLAYILFLNVMRFMDVHQHTYDIFETLEKDRGPEAKRFDAEYEVRNTFSNLVSVRHPWLNLLVLNFGYHNVHHDRPTAPWYRLPRLHNNTYGTQSERVLPFHDLLISFHRYRVERMLNEDDGDMGIAGEKAKEFVGVDGVSFLTTI